MAEIKPRISKRLREAIRLMVEDGLTRAKAAETAGMTDHGLYSAMRKPHVRSLRREMLGNLREGLASTSLARIDALSRNSDSDHVRLDASKHLASLDPDTAPVQRNETVHRYPDGRPGLTIVFGSHPPRPTAIDGGTVPRLPDHLRHLPPPVPHPAQLQKRENPDE